MWLKITSKINANRPAKNKLINPKKSRLKAESLIDPPLKETGLRKPSVQVANICAELNTHYFDLTEDVEVTRKIMELANRSSAIFVPQCGIAPGFINVIGEFLISKFAQCHELKLRVGGLPQFTQNALKYALTWSLDGLINQYINPCTVIRNSQ